MVQNSCGVVTAATAIESNLQRGRGYDHHDDNHLKLPEELVIEILLRLPVRSLLRFKTVCKYWYTVIKSSYFVNNHIIHHQYRTNHHHSPTHLLVASLWNTPDLISVLPLCRSMGLTAFSEEALANGTIYLSPCIYHDQLDDYVLRFPIFDHDVHYILGPVNGLFLLGWRIRMYYDSPHCLVLLNPATRELSPPFLVPDSNDPAALAAFRPDCSEIYTVGFGFNPSTNDYKVVVLWYQRCNVYDPESDIVSRNVSVYSFASDSWKHLGAFGCREPSDCGGRPYFNGACYWLIHSGPDYDHHDVLSFDMGAEVFREIKGPQRAGVHQYELQQGYLFVYNDSLAMFLYCYDPPAAHAPIDLMVMKEEGCWIKYITIVDPTLQRAVRPHGMIWKNNNVILETFESLPRPLFTPHSSELVLYDPNSHEFKESWIHNPNYIESEWDSDFHIYSYKESLVSLNNGKVYSLSDLLQDLDKI